MPDMSKLRLKPIYLAVAACAGCMYIAGAGLANCQGLFYKSIAAAIGSGIGAVSLCTTISAVVTGTAAKLMPTLLRKYPFKLVIFAGVLIVTASYMGTTVATNFPMLAACFVLKGFGSCLIGSTSLNFLVDNWFRKGSGTVLGIAMSLTGIVTAVFSPIFSSLIESRGWQFAMIVMGFISILFCLPLAAIKVTPEEKGLRAYGAEESAEPVQPVAVTTEELPLVKDFTYYVLIVVMFMATVSFCMVHHVATYASSIGLSATTGALLVSTTMIGNMVFKLLMGFLCDKINPLRTSIISFALATLAFFLFLVAFQIPQLVFLAASIFGVIFFNSTLAVGQIIKMLYDRALFTRIYAVILFTSSIANVIFGTLTGYMYDWFGTYFPAMCIFFLFSLIATVLLIMLNNRQKAV